MIDPKEIEEIEEEESEQEDAEIWDDENYAEDEKEDHFTNQLYQVMNFKY